LHAGGGSPAQRSRPLRPLALPATRIATIMTRSRRVRLGVMWSTSETSAISRKSRDGAFRPAAGRFRKDKNPSRLCLRVATYTAATCRTRGHLRYPLADASGVVTAHVDTRIEYHAPTHVYLHLYHPIIQGRSDGCRSQKLTAAVSNFRFSAAFGPWSHSLAPTAIRTRSSNPLPHLSVIRHSICGLEIDDEAPDPDEPHSTKPSPCFGSSGGAGSAPPVYITPYLPMRFEDHARGAAGTPTTRVHCYFVRSFRARNP